ncbi:hypothetical protein [Flavobacterium sp.]|uniref:hypothetical protein n=1 Tax=Flavobacterium sp. TaxID=239 RepID=UPI002602A475|nr:hypothetical protein [Flavobacterium sp.]
MMKIKIVFLSLISFLVFSCQDDSAQRKIEQEKQAKKNEAIFDNINRGWIFELTPLEPATQSRINNWNEWRNFISEINQKPKSTIGAFQKKAKTLADKAVALNNNIPTEFNLPQTKARIGVIVTKIKSMNLFINLNQIQDKKVVKLIGEINMEIDYLQLQLEEIVVRSQIPREEGEPDIIQMKDSSRAVPSTNIDPDLE